MITVTFTDKQALMLIDRIRSAEHAFLVDESSMKREVILQKAENKILVELGILASEPMEPME